MTDWPAGGRASTPRFGRLAFWLIAALCVFARPTFAACTLEKIAELPVEMAGTQPQVSAKINGTAVEFVADSGAFYSGISPAAAAQLKLRRRPSGLTAEGIGGTVEMGVVTVDKLTLADRDIPHVEFLVGGSEGGTGAIGALGQNVLGLVDVEYDLANGVIRLIRPNGCGDGVLAYWARSMPFSVIDIQPPPGGPPPIRVTPVTTGIALVDDHKIRVLFDTGSPGSALTLKAAARVGITPTSPGVSESGKILGIGRKMASTWLAPIASFKIGDEEIKNTKLTIGSVGVGDIDMILGADFFLSHRIYVANGQHKVYFTYNGGPVFRLGAVALTQAGQNQTPHASPIETDDKAAPVDAEGFARRGAAFAGRRDFDQALADLDRAIALAPKEPRYYYARGLIYLEEHQTAAAMRDFDQSLALEPNNPPALLRRAELRCSNHDEAGANSDLEAASSLVPKEAAIRLDLAREYLRFNLYAEAIGELDLWLAIRPDDGERPRALGYRCLARGVENVQLDLALKDCDVALKMGGQSSSVLDARGLIFIRLGQFDKAIADFSAALVIDPKEAWSLYGRGVAKIKKGMAADGKTDIAAATALRPAILEEARKDGLTP